MGVWKYDQIVVLAEKTLEKNRRVIGGNYTVRENDVFSCENVVKARAKMPYFHAKEAQEYAKKRQKTR